MKQESKLLLIAVKLEAIPSLSWAERLLLTVTLRNELWSVSLSSAENFNHTKGGTWTQKIEALLSFLKSDILASCICRSSKICLGEQRHQHGVGTDGVRYGDQTTARSSQRERVLQGRKRGFKRDSDTESWKTNGSGRGLFWCWEGRGGLRTAPWAWKIGVGGAAVRGAGAEIITCFEGLISHFKQKWAVGLGEFHISHRQSFFPTHPATDVTPWTESS